MLPRGCAEILSMSHVIGALPPHGEQLFLILWGIFTFLLFILSFGINLALVILFLLLTCTFLLLAGGVSVGTGAKIHANSAKVCFSRPPVKSLLQSYAQDAIDGSCHALQVLKSLLQSAV